MLPEFYAAVCIVARAVLPLKGVGCVRHGRCYLECHARLHRAHCMKDLTARFAAVVFTIAATLLISILAVGEMAVFRRSKGEQAR